MGVEKSLGTGAENNDNVTGMGVLTEVTTDAPPDTTEEVIETDVRAGEVTTGTVTGAGVGTGADERREDIDHTDKGREGGIGLLQTVGVSVTTEGTPPTPRSLPKPGGGFLLKPDPPEAAET